MRKTAFALPALILTLVLSGGQALAANDGPAFEVTITNVTRGTAFTPILVATHRAGVSLFTPGEVAGQQLSILAEGGDIGPLSELLLADPRVGTLANSAEVLGTPPLLFPGETVTITVRAGRGFDHLSLAAMMLPTNDGFVALNDVELPRGRNAVTYYSPGYDAGSETNDESCLSIPGPQCGGLGEGFSSADGEGFVHTHAGIHGIGDLASEDYDWRNPVARIVITQQ